MLIANVAWRFCALSSSLFRTITAWSLESDFVSGFPKFYSLSLNSAIKLKFRCCSVLLLKASDRFRRCLRIDWKSFYTVRLWYSIPLNCLKKKRKTDIFSLYFISLNDRQRLGYEQCAKNELIFGISTKPKLYFLLKFSLHAKMKFWRLRKYTPDFGLNTNPALLIAFCCGPVSLLHRLLLI